MPHATMRLIVAPASGFTAQAAERITFSGLDQIPTPCRCKLHNGELIVEHNTGDSGRLHVPFPVAERGEVVLTTGTLMHRERPYVLEVELARGKINQLRNQIADWMALGLVLPPQVEAASRKAVDELGHSVTTKESDLNYAVEQSRRAISSAVAAGELLVDTYIAQALALRHRQTPQLPTALSVALPHRALAAPALNMAHGTFNAMTLPATWRHIEAHEGQYDWSVIDQQLEWCMAQHVPVIAGPLVSLDQDGLPDWVRLWSGDIDGFISFAVDYVSTVVERFRGKVAMWQVAARTNSGRMLSLEEEQRLQLSVRLVEAVRRLDPNIPAVLRFDQPYGDYLRRPGAEYDLSPLHFAEALVRAGLQLNGLGIELNYGYLPGGTCSHDRLDLSRLLDLWSFLGLPVHITITAPSSQAADPRSRSKTHVVPSGKPWSPEVQAEWVGQVTPLLLSKAYLHSITWNQLSDTDPHEFPHAGLFDANGVAKPALAVLTQMRKQHLH